MVVKIQLNNNRFNFYESLPPLELFFNFNFEPCNEWKTIISKKL